MYVKLQYILGSLNIITYKHHKLIPITRFVFGMLIRQLVCPALYDQTTLEQITIILNANGCLRMANGCLKTFHAFIMKIIGLLFTIICTSWNPLQILSSSTKRADTIIEIIE